MPAICKIKQKNRWNIDKVSIMEGIGINSLVLRHKEKKLALIKQPGLRS
jgi:hypothetical protein